MFYDWITYYWPQTLSPLQVIPGIYTLPWFYILLQPLRIVYQYPALVIIQLISLFIILKLIKKIQIPKWRSYLVFSSAPVIWNVFMGQIDGILLAAYLTIPAISAFLFLCKPQINLGAAYIAYKKQPIIVSVILVFLVVSAWLIWRWPFVIQETENLAKSIWHWFPPILASGWNWSLWPWGFLLLPFWLRSKNDSGLAISPFLFPYAGLQSLIGPMIFAAKHFPTWALILTWILLWLRWAWMVKIIH